MSKPNISMDLDPDALYEQLLKEAQNLDEPEAKDGTDKTASDTSNEVVFDKAFFDKLASGDAQASEQFDGFVDSALAQGNTPEQIQSMVAEMETAAYGQPVEDAPVTTTEDTPAPTTESTTTTTETPPAANDTPNEPLDADEEFELQKAAVALEFAEKGIDDELAKNPLAKIAGITRETLAAELLGEVAGVSYHQARSETADRIAKIAEAFKPTADQVREKIAELKALGLDVSAAEAQLAEMDKAAAAQTEPKDEDAKPATTESGEAAKTAAEKAGETAREKVAGEVDPKVAAALAVLDAAGIDTAKLAQKDEKGSSTAGKVAKGVGAAALLAGGAYGASRGMKAMGGVSGVKQVAGDVKSELQRRARNARQKV